MQSDQSTPEKPIGQSHLTPETAEERRSQRRKILVRLGTAIGLVLLLGGISLWTARWRDETTRTQSNTPPSTTTPGLKVETVLSGRQHIWEMAFIPSGKMLFTERGGTLSLLDQGKVEEVAKIPDVRVAGEGGLLGLAVDPEFNQNRYIYTCYNSTATDVRIVRWRLADDFKSLQDRQDIVTGMPSNVSGRHSGCRLEFGPDGYLWAGTGDAAQGDTAIQPKNLGGKVLRVDRDGKPATGNLDGGFDARIYSYGHRNVQGLAFFPEPKNGTLGLSTEHGSDVDDEVNELKSGNFGWAPPASAYNEQGVSMTDLTRFPDAISALWSSGSPTQAPAGAAIVQGEEWQGWNGALAVAFLRAEHLKIFRLDASNRVVKEERILSGEYGRLRAVIRGPDGGLYVGTTNGSNDKIIKLTPRPN